MEEVLDDLGGAQGITASNDKYKMITKIEDMPKRCADMAAAIKTLRRYNSECYSGLTQQVFSAILRTRDAMNKANCEPNSEPMKLVVEAMKCIQDEALESVRDAEKKTILASQVLHEANIEDAKMRMRRSCCAVVQSRNYFIDATKAKCGKFEKVYTSYVDSYTEEAFGLICESPEKLKCSELEQLKLDGVAPKSTFFLNPMLKLVKSLDH